MAKRKGLTQEDLTELDRISSRLSSSNYYELLEVEPDAPRAQIRAAYFAFSKRFHPDNFYGVDLGARRAQLEQAFAAFTRAYETLSRGPVRRMYDASLDLDRGAEAEKGPKAASEPESEEDSPTQPMDRTRSAQVPTQSKAATKRRAAPAAHALRRLGASVRQREAAAAARAVSRPPPRPDGKRVASALARELANKTSRDDIRYRAHLRNAERAEHEGRLDVAYRELSAAQKLAQGDVRLIRRMEDVHRRWMLQDVPTNKEAAKQAEERGSWREAAMHWERVAGATDEVEAHLAVARAWLHERTPAERAKAGRSARRAVELAPHDVRAHQMLLEFFEQVGMQRNAARERDEIKRIRGQRG